MLGLPTPFVCRDWDRTENLGNTLLGTDVQQRLTYLGPVPVGWQQASGTPDQWLNGGSFEILRAGGYTKNCPNFVFPFINSVLNSEAGLTVDGALANGAVVVGAGGLLADSSAYGGSVSTSFGGVEADGAIS
jgi:hypothetical protein